MPAVHCRRANAVGSDSDIDSKLVVSTRNRSPSPSLARHRFATDQGRLDSREIDRLHRRWRDTASQLTKDGWILANVFFDDGKMVSVALYATAASRLRAPKLEALPAFNTSIVPLSQVKCEVLFGARRRARAWRRMICSPARCSARVGVGEGAGARGLQSGVVAMCFSARVGVGEGAEARSSINFGRPGALLGSSVAFSSGCG